MEGDFHMKNMQLNSRAEHNERAIAAFLGGRSVNGKWHISRSGFGRMPHRKMQNPAVPGVTDTIDQPMYDSVTFAAGAAMAKTVMFQTTIGQGGKTLAQTNMTVAGTLPAPWILNVRAIKFYVTNNTVPADLQNVLSNVSFTLNVGVKPFLQCPSLYLPAGMGGILTAAAQLGTSGAAQNIPLFSTSNGFPVPQAAFILDYPIQIGALENFNVTLNPETAFNFAAAGGATVGVGATIQVFLDGALTRQAQ